MGILPTMETGLHGFDPTSDLGWYIRDKDDGAYASRRKRREVMTRSGSQPARALHRTHRPTEFNLQIVVSAELLLRRHPGCGDAAVEKKALTG